MWGGYWNGPGGDWVLFPILMLIVMVVMMLIAFRMFGGMMGGRGSWFNAGRPNDQPSDSALETLRERFARGDIDEQEYETKRKLLSRDSSGGGGR